MATRQKALVICPGRGTYNATELGYLHRFHSERAEFVASVDQYRAQEKQTLVSELDGKDRYSLREHSRGDNASALIWACAYADFLSINRDQYDVCAVTGNSMGWYVALGCAGALTRANALRVINTMGTLMHENLIGGQLIYPLVNADWLPIEGRVHRLDDLTRQINTEPGLELALSINLGGMRVFGGNEGALKRLTEMLPKEQDRYPMQLFNHAAFHTSMQEPVAALGRLALPEALFEQPDIVLIDGRGGRWAPAATDANALRDYTLDHQVVQAYDFSLAVQVAVKEYAPDRIIILGPGTTLGGSVAQSLIQIGWNGWRSKADFVETQKLEPFIISMGMESQRSIVS